MREKGFLQVLQRQKIDIMALQEVREKRFPEQLPDNVLNPRGWHAVFLRQSGRVTVVLLFTAVFNRLG